MRADLHQSMGNYRRFSLRWVFTRLATKALELKTTLKEDIHSP
jgi:hypothetical protein